MAGRQNWQTPRWLYESLQTYLMETYGIPPFTLDAAADDTNALCDNYYTKETDGLVQPWHDSTFCNPPFAKFGQWMAKAYDEDWQRQINTCLVGPVGCSQRWFHTTALYASILVPDRRINFIDPTTGEEGKGANRDAMIYLFGPEMGAPVTGGTVWWTKSIPTRQWQREWRRKNRK